MKFFFDNCLSFKIAHALRAIFDKDEFAVLREKYPQDAPDSEWIPDLGKEGDWIVLTDDRLWRNREQKKLLMDSGLIVFSTPDEKRKPRLHERAGQLISMWEDICQEAASAQRGTWFKLPRIAARKYKIQKLN